MEFPLRGEGRRRRMRIGVIGGGIQGACVALEFARRGATVDLFERQPHVLRGASRENEGKIHLGHVYANDASFATARLMCRAATEFAPLLSEYLEQDLATIARSDPFVYAVHARSLLTPDALERRYAKIARSIATAAARPGADYFGERRPDFVRRWTAAEVGRRFDGEHVRAVFETTEIAVDPREVAELLEARLRADPAVRIHTSVRVESVRPDPHGVRLELRRPEPELARFDQVVNCAWDGRLVLDRTAGVPPVRRASFRRKYFLRLPAAQVPKTLRSTTVVLGGFGDVVRYGGGDVFLSWYPVGCQGLETGLSPSPLGAGLTREQEQTLRDGIVGGLADLVPALRRFSARDLAAAELSHGIIFALGDTDVDDPDSRLHQRYQVGPQSFGPYHTIDTGKYTLAPYFARALAQSVVGYREKAA
jgi:glycine/D-amino acid oxidase-like deaminating enzyme